LKDATGNVAGQFSEDVPYQGASETKQSVLGGAYAFVRTVAAHRGKYRLDVAVFDQLSEKITATQSEFEFDGSPQPALSDPVLVGRLDSPPSGADAGDPLLYQGKRVTPKLKSEVRNDAGVVLPVYFMMYPDKQSAAKPTLALQVLSNGALLANAAMPLAENAAQYPTPFIASIPTEKLNPGAYMLRITFSQGAAKAQKDLSFTVVGERKATPAKPVGKEGSVREDEAVAETSSIQGSSFDFVPGAGAGLLSMDDQSRILAGARERALGYAAALPNFTVRETTWRKVSRTGTSNFNARDAFTELVRFSGGVEERKIVERNGEKSSLDRSTMDGTMLNGEFGFLLGAVFNQQTQAKFAWKESVSAGTDRYEVFSFKVDQAHSMYKLRAKEGHSAISAAYDGEVYVDPNTYNIRRVVLRAIDLPKQFPIRESSLRLDYDRVMIGQSDHLVPTAGVIEVHVGRAIERNEVQFKNYRRLGSETTIKFVIE